MHFLSYFTLLGWLGAHKTIDLTDDNSRRKYAGVIEAGMLVNFCLFIIPPYTGFKGRGGGGWVGNELAGWSDESAGLVWRECKLDFGSHGTFLTLMSSITST